MPGILIKNVSSWYGKNQILKNVNLSIQPGSITSFIGPSGCGKSTMLRSLNRLNDRISGFRLEGDIQIGDVNPYEKGADLLELRRNVGIVFQKPNPFPKTIFENVALPLRAHFGVKGSELESMVESALIKAAIWDEVKDHVKTKSGLSLSGGQQQRLCIARALAVSPKVLLMDEPCSALDPIGSANIEDLIVKLKGKHTVVIVTHNMQQALRVSDQTAFFMFGEIEEAGDTKALFESPQKATTRDYVLGNFG